MIPRHPLRYLVAACIVAVGLGPRGAAAAPSQGLAVAAAAIPLMADAKGAPLGTLSPGTLLRVLKHDNDLTEVRLDGWSMVGAEQIAFAAKGQRIILARLTASRPDNRKVLARSQDTYGIDWERVVITGWVSSKDLVGQISSVWQKANAIYQKRCTACHALHQPTEFTANQWPSILRIMTKRAALTPEDTALVTEYLQSHARRPSAGGAEAPAAAGAAGGSTSSRRR